MTRIGDSAEFATLVQAVASQLGVQRVVVEKDYWVTEVLRELTRRHADQFVFKGGTSLSKCFGLVQRFSEDIDILLTDVFDTQGARDRAMRSMVETVTTTTPLTARLVTSSRGVKRNVALAWPRHGSDAGGTLTGIAPEILLEMGTRGSHLPRVERSVTSLLASTLSEINEVATREFISDQDLELFSVPTLHPGRTLVEKLLLLQGHADAVASGAIEKLPTRQGRHVYDVIQLLGSNEVRVFLDDRSTFLAAVEHAQMVSTEHWNSDVARPRGGFADSLIVTGGERVDNALEAAYASDVPKTLIGPEPLPAFALLRGQIMELADKL